MIRGKIIERERRCMSGAHQVDAFSVRIDVDRLQDDVLTPHAGIKLHTYSKSGNQRRIDSSSPIVLELPVLKNRSATIDNAALDFELESAQGDRQRRPSPHGRRQLYIGSERPYD